MEIYRNFINQLDGLNETLIFASNKRVYLFMRDNNVFQFNGTIFVPNQFSYEIYQRIIYKSVFILGFSYFESFLYNLTKECLIIRPEIFIKKEEIEKINVEEEIEKELSERKKFFNFKNKIKYFNKNLKIIFKDEKNKLEEARLIRNCLVHNNGKVNKDLFQLNNKYELFSEIILDIEKIDYFGNIGRQKAKYLNEEVKRIFKIY